MTTTQSPARQIITTSGVDEFTTRKVTALALGTLLQVPSYDGVEEMNRATADAADYVVMPEWSNGTALLVSLLPGQSVTVAARADEMGVEVTHDNGESFTTERYVLVTVAD